MKQILKNALINAGATTAYIMLLVGVIFKGGTIFGGQEPEDNLLIPVAMLLLFVISATVTSFAVLGRPIMWYLDGKKQEAVALLATTVGFLALFAIFFLLILL